MANTRPRWLTEANKEVQVAGLLIILAVLCLRLPITKELLWSGDTTPLLSRSHALNQLRSVVTPFDLRYRPSGTVPAEQGSWFLLILKSIPLIVGVDPVWAQRISFYLLFLCASLSMYLLARHLGMQRWIGAFVASIFTYSPPFFNFLTMGWDYVAWSFAFLPLSILITMRLLRKSRVTMLLIGGAVVGLFAFTTLLPIYVLLILLLVFDFLIKSHEHFGIGKRLLRAFCLFVAFPLPHIFWILSRYRYPVPEPLSVLNESGPSRGAVSGINSLSAIVLRGTQFNDSYWRFFPADLPNAYVALSITAAIASLYCLRKLRQSICWIFAVYWTVLVGTSLADQGVVQQILNEFGLGRDTARLIATASLPIAVLVGCLLQRVSTNHGNRFEGQLSILLPVCFLLVAYPFFRPGISNSLDNREPGIALRPRSINLTAISEVDQLAASSKSNWSVLQLPTFPLVFSAIDSRFDGNYQSTTNPWNALSVNTNLHISDKSTSRFGEEFNNGSVARLARDPLLTIDPGKLAFELHKFGIRYLVIDRTFLGDIGKELSVLASARDGDDSLFFNLVRNYPSEPNGNDRTYGEIFVFEIGRAKPAVKLFMFGRTSPLETEVMKIEFSHLKEISEIQIKKPPLPRQELIVNLALPKDAPISIAASFLAEGPNCGLTTTEFPLKMSQISFINDYVSKDSFSRKIEEVPVCGGIIRLKITTPINELQRVLFVLTVLTFASISFAALYRRYRTSQLPVSMS